MKFLVTDNISLWNVVAEVEIEVESKYKVAPNKYLSTVLGRMYFPALWESKEWNGGIKSWKSKVESPAHEGQCYSKSSTLFQHAVLPASAQ